MNLDRGGAFAQEREPVAPAEAARLQRAIDGLVHVPSDPGYGAARTGGGTFPVDDRFPALVVLPQTPSDVAEALGFAQANALEVSVRSGGHDLLGASTTATGMLIDLARLNAIEIDADSATVVVGAGTRAGELVDAAAPHGFSPMVGMCSNVGMGGLTLGGGLGWTIGTDGAVVDHLLAADIVTADGQLLRAGADENPDLFWALRGGGGNFGVVTAFTYRMPRTPAVLAGTITVRAEPEATLRFMRDYLAECPDELEAGVSLANDGDPMSIFMFCWNGDEAAGQRAIRPLLTFAPVIDESFAMLPLPQFQKESGAVPSRMYGYAGSFDSLNDEAIDAMAEIANRGIMADCILGIGHYMHGAVCRVPVDDTPLIRQSGKLLYDFMVFWDGDTPTEKIRWIEDNAPALAAVHSRQEYINYLSYDDSDMVREGYGRHYPRLAEIKRRYDPNNVFRGNRNIVA